MMRVVMMMIGSSKESPVEGPLVVSNKSGPLVVILSAGGSAKR